MPLAMLPVMTCLSAALLLPAPVTQPRGEVTRAVERGTTRAVEPRMIEKAPQPEGAGVPFRTAVLGLVAVQSAFGLASDRELAGLLNGASDIDWFGTIVDAAFVVYGASTLLAAAGVTSQPPDSLPTTLNGMECQVTLNIGREPGTWMPQDWASSGARLSLPMRLRFSDELIDLGVPGEEMLNAGGRYAKKLYCEGGQFVSATGVQVVKASGGAWTTQASPVPGARSLNFFVDFPDSATRNDVSLPAGRVFFSCACWESKAALPDGIVEGEVDMPDGERVGVIEGPDGAYLLTKGGLSIKRNDWRNLWGAIGDVMLILGRYSFSEAPPPQQGAAEAQA